ncbi:MAG TPA: hypothetical protein DCG49_11535 [Ruminococcus sp.]|nr:hypothetical protein [Ruminococcus sp.]
MNKTARAFKLFFNAAAHPFVIGFGLFMMLGMALAFILDPAPVGSDEYLSMLGSIQMGNIGTIFMVVIASAKMQQNKFYSSCICAKELFTIGPVAVVTILNLLYDTLLAVSAYINLGTAGLADTLVFNTISSMLIIVIGGCYGKKGVPFISAIQTIAYIIFISFPFSIKIASVTQKLCGHNLPAALLFTVCGYILAVTVTLVLENIWWKKGDKFALPNKAMLTALEVQTNE